MPINQDVQIGQVVQRVADVVGRQTGPVLLHQPLIGGNESRYVQVCLDTGWVSSAGQFVNDFERKLCEVTGAKSAVAVVNGTAGLHVALMLARVERETEVLMPSLTFVATANAAAYCGAVPHFCDVSEETLGVDAEKLQEHLERNAERRGEHCFNRATGRRISALVPMHTFGHPVEMDGLMEVAGRWAIPVVEDAAESLGSFYRGKHTGTFGLLGVLSFNGNKIVSTGAGGAILTDDEKLAGRARHLTTTAKVPHPYEYVHDEVGFNYRMPNLNAALGCGQLEKLEEFVERKRRLARRYQEAFAGVEGLNVFAEPKNARSNYWLNALVLDQPDKDLRDRLLVALNQAGLQSRPVWRPMHELPMYRDCPKMDLSVTENLAARIINVPSSAVLAGEKAR
jgi:perosamine synthetase